MSVIGRYGQLKGKEIDEECSICLDEFSYDSTIVTLACKHFFHPSCVAKLDLCPLCRAKIIRADGFYPYLLDFLEQHWPYANGDWGDEEFGELGWEMSLAVTEHPEWTDFIPSLSYMKLKNRFSPPSTEHREDRSELEWKEFLFQDFLNRPEIKSIFQEMAGRFLTKQKKDQKLRILFKMFLGAEEKEALKEAERLCPQPSILDKCLPRFHTHQE